MNPLRNRNMRSIFIISIIYFICVILLIAGNSLFYNYYFINDLNTLQIVIIIIYFLAFLFLIFNIILNKRLVKISLILLSFFAWIFGLYFYEMLPITSCSNLFDCDTPFFVSSIFDIFYLGIVNVLTIIFSIICFGYFLVISKKSKYIYVYVPILVFLNVGIISKAISLIISIIVYQDFVVINVLFSQGILYFFISSLYSFNLPWIIRSFPTLSFIASVSIIIYIFKINNYLKNKHETNNRENESQNEVELDKDDGDYERVINYKADDLFRKNIKSNLGNKKPSLFKIFIKVFLLTFFAIIIFIVFLFSRFLFVFI